MEQTFEELQAGKLVGVSRLKLACGLTEFPEEILTLSDTLEILDLSDNQLTELPASFSELQKLKIVFFARNHFTEFPAVLKECPNLNMIGFKSNQIETVPEDAFPPLLNWLILTDNKINQLPKSIGACHLLQKCALAGNLIEELPAEMANCENLELLRVSANKLKSIPQWLFQLPKLSWVAFGGNPAAHQIELTTGLPLFAWQDFTIKELLGEGASGLISKANWLSKHKEVAIKVFKGNVTSDGLPEDEMAIAIAAGAHQSLIEVLGKIKDHPEEKSGLIMKLISPTYVSLGNPPSFETCTRDVFDADRSFSPAELLKIATSIASVCAQLHSRGINHGDLYAHNILVNPDAQTLLGDFGAATFYDVNAVVAPAIERVEVRAFGCLIEDVFGLVKDQLFTDKQRDQWLQLIENCLQPDVNSRDSFAEIAKKLSDI